EQSLITVESDKASMEVPASHAGVVTALKVKLGDKVNQGSEIIEVQVSEGQAPAPTEQPAAQAQAEAPAAKPQPATEAPPAAAPGGMASVPPERQSPTEAYAQADVPLRNLPHASPSVRKFARELGVNLTAVKGSGAKNRITKEDVQQYVKNVLAVGGSA